MIIGYFASGAIVGGLLAVECFLNYPRAFDLIVLGVYDLFVIIHLLSLLKQPIWLALFLPLGIAEFWIAQSLLYYLFFLSLAIIMGMMIELDLLASNAVH